jgi:cell wall-associated NlpC family hydrolase
MNPARFQAYSRYIGVPYLDKGRDMRGWDCFGLYRYVVREQTGLLVPDYGPSYASADDRADVAAAMAQRGEWRAVVAGAEREGDGVVFLLAGAPIHCGYVLERGTMLHALKGRETCIERYDSAAWNRRIEGFYKWN